MKELFHLSNGKIAIIDEGWEFELYVDCHFSFRLIGMMTETPYYLGSFDNHLFTEALFELLDLDLPVMVKRSLKAIVKSFCNGAFEIGVHEEISNTIHESLLKNK